MSKHIPIELIDDKQIAIDHYTKLYWSEYITDELINSYMWSNECHIAILRYRIKDLWYKLSNELSNDLHKIYKSVIKRVRKRGQNLDF